jgi:hypothetical protein
LLDGDEIRFVDDSSSICVFIECCDVRIAHGSRSCACECGYLHG